MCTGEKREVKYRVSSSGSRRRKGEYCRLYSAEPTEETLQPANSYHSYSSFTDTSLKHTGSLSGLNLVTNTHWEWLYISSSIRFSLPFKLGKIVHEVSSEWLFTRVTVPCIGHWWPSATVSYTLLLSFVLPWHEKMAGRRRKWTVDAVAIVWVLRLG